MGAGSSKLDKHILQHHRPNENKLWMYMPNQELFKCYSVSKEGVPFFFGALESVVVPDVGAVFVMGGLWADHNQVLKLAEKHQGDNSSGATYFSSFQPITDVRTSNLRSTAIPSERATTSTSEDR